MKLILFLCLFCASCANIKQKPDNVITYSWGDERFHDCDQLIDDIYYVYGTDTVFHESVLRIPKRCK